MPASQALTRRGSVSAAPLITLKPRARTAFEAGLSHFPDAPNVRPPQLGFLPLIGTALEFGADVVQQISAGGTVDQQRQARAQYFGQLALQGNVNAAQILIGGTQNTSGNEAPYWQGWINQLQSSAGGQETLQQAQARGAWWPIGSTDTVTNYPIMKAYAAQGSSVLQQASNLASQGAAAIGAAVQRSSVAPWIIGAALLSGALLLRRRR